MRYKMDFYEFVEKIYGLSFYEFHFKINDYQRKAIEIDYKNRGYKK